MAGAGDDVGGGGQLRQAERPARVQLLRRDADLGPEAELAAVGEPGGGVDEHRGRVDAGVTLHGDDAARAAHASVDPATDEDWATEYLSMDMAVRVVDDLPTALEHIARWGSGHSEAIVSDSATAIADFTAGVDAAAVLVNASTRFTDGGEFGFGAEIGISTQKLHARGPLGLPELTSTTYVVTGSGHTR